MRNRANRTLAVALALTLTVTAAALASGPLKGKTYEGAVASKGTSERHHLIPLHAGGNIVLKVAGNGRSVTVRFTSSYAVLYCNTTKALKVQTTKPARISSSGSFKASINERFEPGPGLPPIVQVVSGHFSGKSVSGTINTQATPCGGVTSFSARTH